jgi:GDP-L-fucose synthase
MSVNKYSRIYVAGHAGLIGSAILRRLSDHGFENILACDKAELDLTRQDLVEDFFRKQKPDVVINAAGVVGGIQANLNSPADMVLINSSITTNMFGACLRFPVKKMIVFGSSCMYPRVCHQPMKETEHLTSNTAGKNL